MYRCFIILLFVCCTPKNITIPQRGEAIVVSPSEIWSGVTNKHSRWTGYQFTVDSAAYKFWRDLDYDFPPVYGEKFIVIYDSLHPGWWTFDDHQCGPFFYPYEDVDTTIGYVYYSTMVARKTVRMFWYMYHVKDSSFKKMVYCSDTSLHKNVKQGKEFPVIYDPDNKGRAKMLFEPAGYSRLLPKTRDTLRR